MYNETPLLLDCDYYYREMLFNDWFYKVTRFYGELRNGKSCDIFVELDNPAFTRMFNKAWKNNFKYYETQTDCFSDCMALVWQGLCEFEVRDGATWKGIAENTDRVAYKKLMQYLKTYVSENMKRLNSDYIETTKLTVEDGVRHITHVFYRITPESLQKLVRECDTKEKVELIQTVDKSYWSSQNEYKLSIFMEWVKRYMRDCLKDSQKKLLDELEDANYSTFDRDFDSEKVKPYNSNLKLKLKRIYDRVIASYIAQNKFLTGGFVLNELKHEYNTLAQYLQYFKDESLTEEELVKRLSSHIICSMDNRHWEDMVYGRLSKETELALVKEYQHVRWIVKGADIKWCSGYIALPIHVLNEVTKAIEVRLEELEQAMLVEIGYLESQGEKYRKPVELMYFELPKGGHKMVYLDVSPNGIMFQGQKNQQ